MARTSIAALAPTYRRDYFRWITEAKKPETRERRLKEAIQRLESNRKRVHDPSSAARRAMILRSFSSIGRTEPPGTRISPAKAGSYCVAKVCQ